MAACNSGIDAKRMIIGADSQLESVSRKIHGDLSRQEHRIQ